MYMKPILFNTDMVRALLADRKTATRRVVKPQPADTDDCQHEMQTYDQMMPQFYKGDYSCVCRKCGYGTQPNGESIFQPPYRPGDILYVRETWNYGYCDTTDFEFRYNETFFEELVPGSQKDTFLMPRYFYRTEDLDGIVGMKWRPSIHMPREAARIFLRVTDVRVERLQEIDGRSVLAEGVDNGHSNPAMGKRWENMQLMAFSALWDSTIKKADRALYGWAANPWVWVIEFERCEKPEDVSNSGTGEERSNG